MKYLSDRLNKDKIFNSDVLEILRRKSALILYDNTNGFLVYDKLSGTNYISADNTRVAENILSYVKNGELFCIHENHYAEIIEKRFPVKLRLECLQATYIKEELIKIPEGGFEIRKLNTDHLNTIKSHYTVIDSPGYIDGRLEEGMYGAFFGESIAGFVGKHEEGSIGMLYVLETFRRKNVGLALMSHMVNLCVENGAIPYSQVTVSNEASYALHKKAGFEISSKKVYWLY